VTIRTQRERTAAKPAVMLAGDEAPPPGLIDLNPPTVAILAAST
jgi:hypothetical protein